MISVFLTIIAVISLVPGLAPSQEVARRNPALGLKLTYTGSLEPVAGGPTDSSRAFRVTFAVIDVSDTGSVHIAWVMDETAGKPRWPWSQRFGSVKLAQSLVATSDREFPAIQGQMDGMVRIMPLVMPFFASADKLRPGATWDEGDRHIEVVTREDVGERRCWVVAAAAKSGARSIDWIDEEHGVVARRREIVFLGQGVQHELRLDLDRIETLAVPDIGAYGKAHAALAALRGPVKDRLTESPSATPPATPAFLEQAKSAIQGIREDKSSGPYASLAADVLAETQTALDRQKAIVKLREQLLGKPAAKFKLTTTRGDTIALGDLAGSIVVLHFWEYQAEPKIAPYGETGYLDFLFRQHESRGIRVIGIACDNRLRPRDDGSGESSRAAARREIRAFCEFMNLSYPVALDSTNVIEQYGDPRRVGGTLPLYVVIAGDGTVAEYHPGLWSATADEGLKELDRLLINLKR